MFMSEMAVRYKPQKGICGGPDTGVETGIKGVVGGAHACMHKVLSSEE